MKNKEDIILKLECIMALLKQQTAFGVWSYSFEEDIDEGEYIDVLYSVSMSFENQVVDIGFHFHLYPEEFTLKSNDTKYFARVLKESVTNNMLIQFREVVYGLFND